MTEPRSSWQKQTSKAISNFMDGYDWCRIYGAWKRRIDDFVTPIHPVFQEVHLHDPGNTQRDQVELAWWSRRQLNEIRRDCQQHFDELPGSYGSTHPQTYLGRKGELQTLELLFKYRDDLEQVAAVLISASIFSRLGGRAGYPKKWPGYLCVKTLHDLINDRWMSGSGYWHHANTTVLPYTNYDDVHRIDDLKSLICYLAEEHAALLHQFTPVAVRFTPERSPVLSSV
ncbi:hypothetical protein [Pseudomonas defluvii]|uniref:hypothetical protein n=1 Tax=Pseudomonas defluvii TaxID=1876757 RepID=UPI000F78B628|nr:hypothetical protein [Pseudomonas defluvii]